MSVYIDHVDTTAVPGTLDIYMSNTAACSYCPDSTYNKNIDDWFDKLIGCENPSLGDTTWVAYDNSYTETECWNRCSGVITQGTCTGADDPAVTNFAQPTNEADCLDPAGDNNATGTPGTWTIVDGMGDACDACPYDENNDGDTDGICDCTLTATACSVLADIGGSPLGGL